MSSSAFSIPHFTKTAALFAETVDAVKSSIDIVGAAIEEEKEYKKQQARERRRAARAEKAAAEAAESGEGSTESEE